MEAKFMKRSILISFALFTALIASDGKEVYIGSVMQHIEEAGIHSGDSACSLPPVNLTEEMILKTAEKWLARLKNAGGPEYASFKEFMDDKTNYYDANELMSTVSLEDNKGDITDKEFIRKQLQILSLFKRINIDAKLLNDFVVQSRIDVAGYGINPSAYRKSINKLKSIVQSGRFINADKIFKAFIHRFKLTRAAGGVVFNKKGDILMIYRHGRWDLPKGKKNSLEKNRETARREVMEETGIRKLKVNNKLQVTYHFYRRNRKLIVKKTHWYLMKARKEQDFVPAESEGISKVRWIPRDKIRKKKKRFEYKKKRTESFHKPERQHGKAGNKPSCDNIIFAVGGIIKIFGKKWASENYNDSVTHYNPSDIGLQGSYALKI
jgi:8-oxo-dGTP pyrophosphatase MutT (NUDIX family)